VVCGFCAFCGFISQIFASNAKVSLKPFLPGLQVWLKHDLRLDDHPGFLQASEGALPVVPLFCLQPELYVHLLRTPFGVEGMPSRSAELFFGVIPSLNVL
jgi:hypothetical protein